MYDNQPLANDRRFTQFISVMSGVEIILSDDSHYWVVLTFYLTTHAVQWCPHHFIQQFMLLGCADIILSDNLHQNSF
jgi:hypothetical protein